MQAFVIEHFGEPNLFQVRDLPKPELLPDSVLIKVYVRARLNFTPR